MKREFSKHALTNKIYGFLPGYFTHIANNEMSIDDLSKDTKQVFQIVRSIGNSKEITKKFKKAQDVARPKRTTILHS